MSYMYVIHDGYKRFEHNGRSGRLRHIASMMLPQGLIWVGIAVVVWNFFTPSMERMATLHPRWVLEIYVRNVVMFTVLTSLWSVTHFYCIQGVLHIRWVYDRVRYLHHRNVNPGPWSGLSMHPVEHMMYLSMFLLWWVVPAHPVILILTLSSNSLATAVTHSGFERFEIGRRGGRSMKGADHFHHLHHRYFECNYGNRPVPLDTLSGTFHDGTPEANARMRERMKARGGSDR